MPLPLLEESIITLVPIVVVVESWVPVVGVLVVEVDGIPKRMSSIGWFCLDSEGNDCVDINESLAGIFCLESVKRVINISGVIGLKLIELGAS